MDISQIKYVRIWVRGDGIEDRMWNQEGFVALNGAPESPSLQIPAIPKGRNRIVTAQAYDGNKQPIPAISVKGFYSSPPASQSVTVKLRWRFVPTANVLEKLLERHSELLAAINAEQLQQLIDQILFGNQSVDTPFAAHPARLAPGILATLLQDNGGRIPDLGQLPQGVVTNVAREIVVQNPLGGAVNRDITLSINDPTSAAITIKAGVDRGTLAQIAPGTWRVTATIKDAKGDAVTQGTLTVSETGTVTLEPPILAPPPFVTAIQPAQLAGWWAGEGNALDWVGTGHGTLRNGAALAAGKVGQGFSFDGLDDYVLLPPATLTDFTVAAWVKPNAAPAQITGLVDGDVCGITDDWGVQFRPDGRIQVQIGNPDAFINSAAVLANGAWAHVLVSRNTTDGRVRIYINGVLDTVAYAPHNRPVGGSNPTCDIYANSIALGNRERNAAQGNPSFNGLLDEVQIYNQALSLPAIQSLFNGQQQAAVGENVTLVGGGFKAGDNTVRFGAANGTVTAESGTRLIAQVPVGLAGNVALSVTANGQTGNPATLQLDPLRITSFYPLLGVPGLTQVTIKGFNLAGTTEVRFNNNPAVFNVVDANTVTATFPAAGGTGPIKITNAQGNVTTVNDFLHIPGLVGWWRFDEGAGAVANDSSGNGNTVNLTGGPVWQPASNCYAGGCLNFDAIDDLGVIAAPNNVPFNNGSRTLLGWLYPNVPTSMWGVVHYGQFDCLSRMYALAYHGRAAFWGGCNDHVSNILSAERLWFFQANVFNGAQVKVWGNNQFEVANTGALNTANSQIFFGGETTNNGGFYRDRFDGRLDEIQLYNRNLTDAEVQAIYQAVR